METNKFYFDLQECVTLALSMTLPRPVDVMLRYIEQNYTPDKGEIVPIYKPQTACDIADTLSYMTYNFEGQFETDEPFDREMYPKKMSGTLIARGNLATDVDYVDSDPYETAGGFRRGIVRKGSLCDLYLSHDYHGIHLTVRANVSIIVDHYNNNFFGVSTGGGTREFTEGQNKMYVTVKRFSRLGHDVVDFMSINAIDCKMIRQLIGEMK